MDNLDVMVLRSLRDWRKSGHRALLATVVRTWGSSPRPVGSIMALCDSGSVVGSVSGGCIEDDLIDRFTKAYANAARAVSGVNASNGTFAVRHENSLTHLTTASADLSQIPSGPPQHVKYGITADEAHRFGLPCGGTLELLLEFDPAPAQLEELVQRLEKGELVQRVTLLATGESH